MLSRWIKIGAFLALVVIGGAAVLVVSRWPFTRDTIVRTLQEKFSSTVELNTFHGTYLTPGCIAEGVTFRRNRDRNAPPIATVEKLTIEAGYLGFLSKRIRLARVQGLRIFVSPRSERADNEARPGGSLEQFALIIDEIIADGAVVEFASGEPGTEPLKFEIHKLTLNSVADDRPMSFHAALLNPKPPGEIRTDGQFGPLQPQDVGHTLRCRFLSFSTRGPGRIFRHWGNAVLRRQIQWCARTHRGRRQYRRARFPSNEERSCGTPENAIPCDCERDGWRRRSHSRCTHNLGGRQSYRRAKWQRRRARKVRPFRWARRNCRAESRTGYASSPRRILLL